VSWERILLHQEGAVARITLNRPGKRNALDARLIGELQQALEETKSARVVLLTGAGKDFCAGADLEEIRRLMDDGAMANLEDARRLARLFLAMRKHPAPIVAAVRGRALAGGCGLATACDIILAAETAEFGYPEVHIGFVPAIVMAILRRSVPEKRAFAWIATGRRIPAREARDAGLVAALFAEERFEEETARFARDLAARPSAALSLAKSLLYQMDGMVFETAIECGAEVNALARLTEDCRAGIDAFLGRNSL
jgi:methylglutaconyl-CoA hydratase